MDALTLARMIADGRITAVQAVEAALQRIDERDSAVLAWKTLDREQALAEAASRDAETARSLLHGVPVGVKDVIDTANLPTGYGSPIHEGARPAADAACVAMLREAGMVVLGKTVTTEFAMRTPGVTRNPFNPAHTPGGSSSGSAAAVADGQVPLAIGTQTSGSVIRPAAFCGAVGFKPSWGTVPRAGLKMLAESLDVIGAMARTPMDAHAFVQAMAGQVIAPAAAATTAPRFGFCRTAAWDSIEPAGAAAMETAVMACQAAGASIKEVELPAPFSGALDAHDAIMTYEAHGMLAYERTRHWDQISPALQAVMQRGAAVSPAKYAEALQMRRDCRHSFSAAFADVDVLLTPAAPGEAPEGLDFTGAPEFNRIWTFVGAPCVTTPGLLGPKGLPVGIQVIGGLGDDGRAIAAAGWLQHVLGGQS
ncbi:MAG: amidase [Alphaproteobacteria bacterium]